MKYIKKIPETDIGLRDKLISEGWSKIKGPSNIYVATLLSIPFMIINGIIFVSMASYLYPPITELLNNLSSNNDFSVTLSIDYTTLLELFAFILLMLMHEFLHACFIPDFIKSGKVYWGMNLLFAFVYTTEKIKKERYIIISLMPLILLSIVLPIILSIFGCLNEFILVLCFINAISSSVDCLNICIILKQVPKGAYIVSNGNETYYKL